MELLLFRTDIKSKKKRRFLKSVFKEHPSILKWTIDLEDIDNVLRIEAEKSLKEDDVIGLVREHGFYIDALAD